MGTVLVLVFNYWLISCLSLSNQLFTTMLHVTAIGAEYVEHMQHH